MNNIRACVEEIVREEIIFAWQKPLGVSQGVHHAIKATGVISSFKLLKSYFSDRTKLLTSHTKFYIMDTVRDVIFHS